MSHPCLQTEVFLSMENSRHLARMFRTEDSCNIQNVAEKWNLTAAYKNLQESACTIKDSCKASMQKFALMKISCT